MTVENIEELNEDSLFDEAVGDEPAEQPAPEPQPEPDAKLTPEPERAAVDDNAPQVPSWRVREINEEKRQIAAENERMRAELAQLRQAQQQPSPRQEQSTAEKVVRPDPLLDPDGYAAAIREELRQEALNERREESLIRARESNQTEFDEAYAAAQRAIDPVLRARMQSSRDPGKTLLEWHRENKTKAEIGNDLTAYKQRLREEALKDPEFRKAAMEAWRNEGQAQQPNGRPRVELPPSLNGTSRAGSAVRASQDDLTDDALWDQTTA